MNQMSKAIKAVFWALVVVFVIIIGIMFVLPILNSSLGLNALAAWPVFLGLGVALIVLAAKQQTGGRLKKFLLLTGASAAGMPVFAVLHNLVSALFNTEEPFFFILAVMVCPIAFLVGAVGTIAITAKSRPDVPAETPQGGQN